MKMINLIKETNEGNNVLRCAMGAECGQIKIQFWNTTLYDSAGLETIYMEVIVKKREESHSLTGNDREGTWKDSSTQTN